jgi:glycosyltransferase involved in cell wall biosynthesis
MAIIIFGDNFSFPEGNAATNRIYTYAKGFIENDVKSCIICNRNDYIENGNGILDGIRYYNPLNQSKRSESFFSRNWSKLLKYVNTIKIVKGINKDERITAIISDTDDLVTYLFSFYLAKRIKTILIVEKSEHPLRYYQKNGLRKVIGLVKLRIETGLCDGILCISQLLRNFYENNGLSYSKLILIPSTVDPGRFSSSGENPFNYSYIGYFGGLTFNRDNIDVLVRAFSMISSKHPEVHLVMGGFCSEDERNKLKNLILDLKISSKVEVLEYLPRTEIVRYIVHSQVLVMVRAKDFETSASFPSKLTEYLSTSKPVLTVNVGEISDYLTDNVNSFIVEPGNQIELAEKMDYILNNYELALEIAKRGKQLTDQVFNYNFQAKRMIEFIYSLNSEK